MNKITDKSQLIPGQCYCVFTQDEPDGGALVWYCADGNFYDANYDDTEGDPYDIGDWDYLVAQTGAFNAEYAA